MSIILKPVEKLKKLPLECTNETTLIAEIIADDRNNFFGCNDRYAGVEHCARGT